MVTSVTLIEINTEKSRGRFVGVAWIAFRGNPAQRYQISSQLLAETPQAATINIVHQLKKIGFSQEEINNAD
jgi:hypothetical protein